MPSSATITAYIVAVAGTKARASQFNTNFSNYRGHILPIDPNTAASAHNQYDLGATDAMWRRLYVAQAPYINGVQPGRMEIDTMYDGSQPADVIEDIGYLGRIGFPTGTLTSARFQFIVPAEYTPGNRISLDIAGFADTGGSHCVLQTVAALYRPTLTGLDDASLTSPANVLTSTANVFIPTTTGLMTRDTGLHLTDSNGKINSITVTAGHVISVDFARAGNNISDSNTGYFYLTNVIVDLNL